MARAGILMKAFIVSVLLLAAACAKMPIEERIDQGAQAFEAGDYQGAYVQLRDVLEEDPRSFEARYLLGRVYFETGRYQKAENEFKKVQKQNPGHHGLSYSLAKAYFFNDKYDLAREIAQGMLDQDGQVADGLAIMGRLSLLDKDFGKTIEHLDKAFEGGHSDADSYLYLAKAHELNGKVEMARRTLSRLLEISPDDTKGLHALARFDRGAGDLEAALLRYEMLIELSPDDDEAYFYSGLIHLRNKEVEKASKVAGQMLAKFPDARRSNYLRGCVELANKDFEKAIVYFQRAHKAESSFSGSYYLGISYFVTGQLELALNSFNASLDKAPGVSQSRVMAGLTLLRQGRIEGAIGQLKRAVELKPSNAFAHNALANAYLANGDYDEAMVAFDKALGSDPRMVDALLGKSRYFFSIGDMESAEVALENVITTAPDKLENRLLLGRHYIRNQNYPKAEEVLKAGLSKESTDAIVYNYLAQLRIAQRRTDEAVDYLNSALEADTGYLTPHLNLATHYAARHEYDKALKHCEALLAKKPKHLTALTLSASLSELGGDEAGARAYLERAHQTGEPLGTIALANYYLKRKERAKATELLEGAKEGESKVLEALGSLYLGEKKYAEAIKAYKDLEKIAPVRGGRHLVKAYSASGQNDEAIKRAKKHRDANPEASWGYVLVSETVEENKDHKAAVEELMLGVDRGAKPQFALWQVIGDIYSRNDQLDEAIGAYGRSEELNPASPLPAFSLGKAYDTKGDKKRALAHYTAAIERDSGYAPALNNLAYLYLDNYGEPERGLRFAIRAYQSSQNDPYIMDTLGYALHLNSRNSEAAGLLSRAANLSRGHPSILYHFALSLNGLGEKGKARQALKAALANKHFPEREQAQGLLSRLSE